VKRGWWIFLLAAAACVAVAIFVALVWSREREPEYKGRKLSAWIRGASWGPPSRPVLVNESADQAERREAVHHIGTNALPYLLKWIEACEPPKQNSELDSVAMKVMTKATAVSWLQYRSRKFYRACDAAWGIDFVGAEASPAVPELVRLSHSTNSMVAQLALGALGGMEQKVSPELRDAIHAAQQAAKKPALRDYTNSPVATAPGRFAVGHLWKTNSNVRVPEEAPLTNSKPSGN
jgi:hypothetical protein